MRWSYKTVYYELKKEGLLGSAFLDEGEVEESLNEYGHAGWELVSLIEVKDGLIGVLKQPLDYPIESLKEDDFSKTVNLNPPERKKQPEQPVYEEIEEEQDQNEADELILHPVEEEDSEGEEQYYASYEEWEADEPEEVEADQEKAVKKERKIGEIRIE